MGWAGVHADENQWGVSALADIAHAYEIEYEREVEEVLDVLGIPHPHAGAGEAPGPATGPGRGGGEAGTTGGTGLGAALGGSLASSAPPSASVATIGPPAPPSAPVATFGPPAPPSAPVATFGPPAPPSAFVATIGPPAPPSDSLPDPPSARRSLYAFLPPAAAALASIPGAAAGAVRGAGAALARVGRRRKADGDAGSEGPAGSAAAAPAPPPPERVASPPAAPAPPAHPPPPSPVASLLRSMLAAGGAQAVSTTVTFPLDTIKSLVQCGIRVDAAGGGAAGDGGKSGAAPGAAPATTAASPGGAVRATAASPGGAPNAIAASHGGAPAATGRAPASPASAASPVSAASCAPSAAALRPPAGVLSPSLPHGSSFSTASAVRSSAASALGPNVPPAAGSLPPPLYRRLSLRQAASRVLLDPSSAFEGLGAALPRSFLLGTIRVAGFPGIRATYLELARSLESRQGARAGGGAGGHAPGSASPPSPAPSAPAPVRAAPPPMWSSIAAGATTGFVAGICLHPLEVAKTMSQVGGVAGGRDAARTAASALGRASASPPGGSPSSSSPSGGSPSSSPPGGSPSSSSSRASLGSVSSGSGSSLRVLSHLVRTEGVSRLFRGCFPSAVRLSVLTAVQLSLYSAAKGLFTSALGLDASSPAARLPAALVSGLASVAVCAPLDIVKMRAMTDQPSVRRAVRTIWREDGGRGFFRGVGPTALWFVPNSAIMLSTVDLFATALGGEQI